MGCFGIIGNLCSIVMFSRKKFQKNFHLLLCFLAGFDLLYISQAILLFSIPQLVKQCWKNLEICQECLRNFKNFELNKTRVRIKSSSSDSRNPTGADISLVTSLLAATGARQPYRFKQELFKKKTFIIEIKVLLLMYRISLTSTSK